MQASADNGEKCHCGDAACTATQPLGMERTPEQVATCELHHGKDWVFLTPEMQYGEPLPPLTDEELENLPFG